MLCFTCAFCWACLTMLMKLGIFAKVLNVMSFTSFDVNQLKDCILEKVEMHI